MKDTWINFRSDQNTKERFEKLVLTTHKNKQELMNDLIDSYLLLNNDEYNRSSGSWIGNMDTRQGA